MISPSPSVTVMTRPAADPTTTPEMGIRWPKQARHTSQMDRLRTRGEELAVAERLQGPQDATGWWPHHHRRGGGSCWKVLELPFSTRMNEHALTRDSLHGPV